MDKEKAFQICSLSVLIGINMTIIAQYGLLTILTAFLIFHICVLFRLIPYKMVWGGRLKSDTEMYRFEIFSIFINSFFLFVILVQAGVLNFNLQRNLMTIILWAMSVLFLFNTIGNITSKNKIERRLFTPITIILTVFLIILALTN